MKLKKKAPAAASIGAAMAARRQRAALSQEQLAEQLGIGPEAVSRMERGVVMPSIQRLISFAEVVGCSVDDLLLAGSGKPRDQAAWLTDQLQRLTEADREFVVDVVGQLCERFSTDRKS